MATYLEDHPPARTQFRRHRRAKPTGCIVAHTAESVLDLIGSDSGAESVAAFIARRTDAPGSYHLIGDRDSIVPLVPFGWEAFGDGTGSNPYAIHIALAMRAADWPHLSAAHRDQLVATAAAMAAMAAGWLLTEHGIVVPAQRITRAASTNGAAGFIPHADRDPARRTDPGPGFPWFDFLVRFQRAMNRPRPDLPEETPMPTIPTFTFATADDQVRRLYTIYSPTTPRSQDIIDWGRILFPLIAAGDHSAVWEHLKFIQWALASEVVA